jgi:hypothetical protein
MNEELNESVTKGNNIEETKCYELESGAASEKFSCIFDEEKFAFPEACFEYMAWRYSFSVPYYKYLVAPEELLLYLLDKVKGGGVCLYCNQEFTSGHQCQEHMIHESHCRIDHSSESFFEEFDDFYDFPNDFNITGNTSQDIHSDENRFRHGQLLLPHGRIAESRENTHMREHNHKNINQESFSSNLRSKLMTMSTDSLWQGERLNKENVDNMTDKEVERLISMHQQRLRKYYIKERRNQIRKEWIERRRDCRSLITKSRKGEQLQDQINDYHGQLL